MRAMGSAQRPPWTLSGFLLLAAAVPVYNQPADGEWVTSTLQQTNTRPAEAKPVLQLLYLDINEAITVPHASDAPAAPVAPVAPGAPVAPVARDVR